MGKNSFSLALGFVAIATTLVACAPMSASPELGNTTSQVGPGPSPGGTTDSTTTPGGTTATPPPGGAVPSGAVRKVGPGKQHATIAAAITAASAGDTIEIDPGTYTNDFPSTVSKSLTLKGVGSTRPKLTTTQHAPNRKGLLVVAANITLQNLEITGVTVSESDGANGSAIRFEGGSLMIDNCYIHRNQNGIMGAPGTGDVTIYRSEFALNGVTDSATYPSGFGYTHNIYVNAAKLSVIESYIFSANVGHNVKSRSTNTVIQRSVIADGANGTGSYSIELPNGGNLTVENSLIQKGPSAGNRPFVAFAKEGLTKTSNSIVLTGNTFIDDNGPASVVSNDTTVSTSITGNRLYNMTSSDLGTGPISQSGNTFQTGAPYASSYWTTTVPSPWPTQ